MAVPFGESAIGDAMERLTPEGIIPTQTGVMVTEELLKPFNEVKVIGMDTDCPCENVIEVVAVSEKSGTAVALVVVLVVVLLVCVDATTVSVVEPESPIGVPVAVTVYAAAETLLTVKEPAKAPFEIEQDGALTTAPESEQLESLVEKPVPETWTLAPTDAEAGFSARLGEEGTTVK